MQKEIGGYFEFEKLISNEYYPELIKLNSACAALLYSIKVKNINKVYLPYYLCNSVKDACINNGTKVSFYSIDESFLPVFEKQLKRNEYLYIVNYYGFITNKQIIEFKQRYRNQIIVDNVQAFFQKPVEGVITLYSCRKWFGVPDGAYLSIDKKLDEGLEYETALNRTDHLIGRLEKTASEYYQDYIDNEAKFSSVEIRKMSRLSEVIMGAIDYENVIKQRNNNFNYLKQNLSGINSLHLEKRSVNAPFCYPLLVKNGVELRNILIENKVYVPILWPSIDNSQIYEYGLSLNLLQIPCDQRYSGDDLIKVVKILKG
jgi:hypothetical protein